MSRRTFSLSIFYVLLQILFILGKLIIFKKRIKEHRNKTLKSAKYIRYFQSFELVYSETYDSRKEAMRREYQLKNWSKAKKEALIIRDLNLLKKL